MSQASSASQGTESVLYIVDPATRKVTTATMEGEIASEPLIGGTGSNYRIYVVTFNMTSTTSPSAQSGAGTLYAFDANGKLKFKTTLDE